MKKIAILALMALIATVAAAHPATEAVDADGHMPEHHGGIWQWIAHHIGLGWREHYSGTNRAINHGCH